MKFFKKYRSKSIKITNMTALFRPWMEEMEAGKCEFEKLTVNSNVPTKYRIKLPTESNYDQTCENQVFDDRDTRYKSIKEHIKKRSEKCLLKRCRVKDNVKTEISDAKKELSHTWASPKPENLCSDMGYLSFPLPNYLQALDLLPEDNSKTCILPLCNGLYADSEMLDAALTQGFHSSLFEEYARFLTEQQKQVAERARKQRPKKFRCPHCQVGFSNNGQLKGHIRIHTGERPFKCDAEACGKSFTRNEELTRHRRIHSGLRPFPCPECGKRFGRKDHLKKHIKTHFQQRYQLVPILSSHCSYLGCNL